MPIFRPQEFTFFPFFILFKRIKSIDMTPCVISFLVSDKVNKVNVVTIKIPGIIAPLLKYQMIAYRR